MCRWDGNIKLDLKEIVYEVMKRTDLAHVRCQGPAVVNTVLNLRFHETRGVF
jgi:hypothetical protein